MILAIYVGSTFGTDSLELPTTMSLHFILSPPCLETYSTSTAFSSLRIEKGHTAQCLVNRGCSTCGIWSLARTFWTRLDKWAGCWVPLPVISLSWCSSLAPHHITQPTKNFSIVLFVNSLTFWCILIVNNAFVIKEQSTSLSSCSELGVPFLASETLESSVVMTGLLLLGRTSRPKIHHK